jgi:cyanamide hydratase
MSGSVQQHGWTAVPRSLQKLVDSRKEMKAAQPLNIKDIKLPESSLVDNVQAYAKKNLSTETYNHSMRVYYYGITSHF